jgi:hemerythrin-like domain-containing protein
MDVGDLVGVRERIRADHAELRVLLEGVAAAAQQLLRDAGSPREEAAVATLRAAATSLVARFRRHLDMEESKFLPILRRIDGWGDVRAEEMLFEHQEQRLVLAAMLDDARLTQVDLDLLDELRGFIRLLTRDMDLEELMLAALVQDACAGPSPV